MANGLPPANVGGTNDYPTPPGIGGLGYLFAGNKLLEGISEGDAADIGSAIGMAIGKATGNPLLGLVGYGLGTIGKKIGTSPKLHKADVPAVSFGNTGGLSVLDNYELNFPKARIDRQRSAQHRLPVMNKGIDFALEGTKKRLAQLGMNDILGWIESRENEYNDVLGKEGPYKVLVGGALQQRLDTIKGAETIIDKRFKESGLDPKIQQQFDLEQNRASYQNNVNSLFNTPNLGINDKVDAALTQRGRGGTLTFKGGDFDLSEVTNVGLEGADVARLGNFQTKHGFSDPSKVNNLLSPSAETQDALKKAFVSFGGNVSSTGDGRGGHKQRIRDQFRDTLSPELQSAYDLYRPEYDSASDSLAFNTDRDQLANNFDLRTSFEKTPYENILSTQITDISEFLESVNNGTFEGDVVDKQVDTGDDPNEDININVPLPQVPDADPNNPFPKDGGDGIDLGDNGGFDFDFDIDIPVGDFNIPSGGGGYSGNTLVPASSSIGQVQSQSSQVDIPTTSVYKRTPIKIQQTPGILSNINKGTGNAGILKRFL